MWKSQRVLIKINERVLNQDGVLIKVNERNNSDIIKVHARAHDARTRAEPYTPCSVGRCRVIVPCARFGDVQACSSSQRPTLSVRAGDRLGYGSQVDTPDITVFELSILWLS